MFMDRRRILPGGGCESSDIEIQEGVCRRVELKWTVRPRSTDEAELKFEHALEDSKRFTDAAIQQC